MSTFDKVKAIVIEKLNADPAKIVDNAKFIEDLGADSLDLVEFVMEIEKEFGITIPDEDTPKLQTVGGAVKYIDEHKKA